jgi:hypothetical protein
VGQGIDTKIKNRMGIFNRSTHSKLNLVETIYYLNYRLLQNLQPLTNITPEELIRRGYKRLPKHNDAFTRDNHILYSKYGSWFLQRRLDEPAIRKKPIYTFEELIFVLHDESN